MGSQTRRKSAEVRGVPRAVLDINIALSALIFSGGRLAPIRLAWNNSVEAACLTRHDKFYYLFLNWGQCCRGTNSTYEVRVGRATKVTGPYLDRTGDDLVNGGGTMFLETTGRFIGPGHIGILNEGATNWFSYHYYDADTFGRSRLGLGQIHWTEDGWPVAAKTSPAK